jgi:hypothetical protein
VKFNGAVVMDEGNSASALNVNPGVKAGFIMLMQMSATSTGHILGNISIESPGVSGACTVDTAPFAIPFTAPIAVEITMQASLSDSWIVTTQNLQMNILQPHP